MGLYECFPTLSSFDRLKLQSFYSPIGAPFNGSRMSSRSSRRVRITKVYKYLFLFYSPLHVSARV